jgi:outer membrane receptor protein involved in Fe transport
MFRSFCGRIAVAVLCALAMTASAESSGAQSPTATLRGRVLASESSTPLEGVLLDIPGTRLGAMSDAKGEWRIEGLTIGRVLLRARRLGLDTLTRVVELRADGVALIELRMSSAASVVAPVVVSATREAQRRVENSATIDVIGGAELRLARASHPAQVMKRIPGVYVSQLSGEGHSMAIRQPITTKPMYLYLEDGVPTRATGFFNHNAMYEVNLPQAGGVEVLKGPGTALYGSDAIGGVVNALTREAPPVPSADLSIEGGRYGFQRVLFSGGSTRGNHGVRVDANLTQMTGWRENAPYDRQSATLRWDARLREGLSVRTVITTSMIDQNDVLAQSGDQFIARDPINRSPLAFRKVEALRWSSAIEQQHARSSWSITPFARRNVLELLPSWQLTFNPQVWDTRNTSYGVLARARRDFAPLKSRVIVGADVDVSPGSFTADQAVLQTQGTGAARIFESYTLGVRQYDYDVTFRQASPYVHTEFSPLARVRIDAGLRYDVVAYDYTTNIAPRDTGRFRIPGNQTRDYQRFSPKVGVTADVAPWLNLYGAFRTGFRAPSHSQLFQQNDAASTVDLKPVTVESAEVGIRGEAKGRLAWSLAAYDMRLQNDIITFVTATNTRIATNAGSTRHRGLEGSLGARVLPRVRLDLSAAIADHRYTDWTPQAARPASGNTPAVAEVSYSGARIEQAPRVLGNALLTLTPKQLRGGRVAAEWSHTGRYPMDPSGTVEYRGHDLITLHANAYVRGGVEVFARAVNVADKTYAELAGYDRFAGQQITPGTPRSVFVGMRYAWER